MSLKTVLKSIGRVLGFAAKNLTGSEALIAKWLPEFAEPIAAFSQSLARERASIIELADHTKELVRIGKGVEISSSLATHLAQAALNYAWPEIEKEAVKLLGLK